MRLFKRKPQAATGVGATFCASHRDQISGQVHGHSYHVKAWLPFSAASSATVQQHTLKTIVARLDHTTLPDRLAWAEKLAEHIFHAMRTEHSWYDGSTSSVLWVEVSRPLEDLYARWPA